MFHNDLLHEFYATMRMRYPRDGIDMTYSEWICANTSLRGKKYSFSDYAFQRAIADDMAPNLSVIKPSQVGLTEIQLRKALAFAARNRGTSTIFTLPNEKMFKRISKTRVRPLIQSERAFQGFGEEKASNSMDLYEIGGSFVYFTGMSEGDATSIPADMLAHDEVDLSDQKMIGLFQSRLQNSKFRITHKFSTPSHPGYGIDGAYQVSDQREYMCVCRACNHWQVPLFDMNFLHLPGYHGSGKLADLSADEQSQIDFHKSYVKCERCSARLDVLNAADREWVAKFPARSGHGYRVRPLMTASLMPEYIVDQLIKMRSLDNIRGWTNTVLGETHSDGSNQLTDEAIKRVLKAGSVPEVGAAPVAISIDVGQVCHVIVGRIDGEVVHPIAFFIVPVTLLEEKVEELLATYNVVAGAIDRMPYTPTADAIFAKSRKLIIPTHYSGQALTNLKLDEFKDINHCQINRTAAIDRVVSVIRRQMIHIEGHGPYTEIITQHLKDMIRIEDPEKEAIWAKLNGNDHFFHALALLQIAPRIFQVIAATKAVEVETRTMTGIIGVKGSIDFAKSLPYRTRSPDARSLP